MKASINCIKLIEFSESFKSIPYLCPAKVPTIGFGSTRYEDGTPVTLLDKPISRDRAEQLMLTKLGNEYEPAVNRYLKVPVSQGAYDSLVSFTYNEGANSFRTSTLLKLINENKLIAASAEFKKWIWADGKKQAGLVIRRESERKLFLGESA